LAEYDSVIPAGGSGKLVATTKTPPLLDRRVSKSVAVRTDAKGMANINLRFSVDVRTPIHFLPSNRLVVTTLEGEQGRKGVLLRRADGQALEILQADTGDPSIEVVTTPVLEKDQRGAIEAIPGDVWLELVLDGNAPVGSKTGKLHLSTNHPVAPSLEVSYAMRVRPLIEPRPAGVRLWPSPVVSGEGHSNILTLSLNRKGRFTVTDVAVSHPEIFSANVISDKPEPRQLLRVELTEGVGPDTIGGTIQGWIEIATDVPGHSTLAVPVLAASSREGTLRGFPTARQR
jgi:hypothetical protein